MQNFIYVICEYNPPHRGHEYMLAKARSRARAIYGEEPIVVCVMSTHMTQRGTPAATDAFTRAEAAILIGADLVLSLPFPHCASSAENFARGGVAVAVGIAAAFPNAAHMLVFGSECGDTEALTRAASRISSEDFRARLYDGGERNGESARSGYSEYSGHSGHNGHNARSLQSLYAEMYGADAARVLDGANDTLGIEYIRALSLSPIGRGIEPLAIARVGARHDADASSCADGDEFASSSAIRAMWARGESARELMPPCAADVIERAARARGFASEAKFGAYLLALLRMKDADGIDGYAECGGGVGRRLLAASRTAGSYAELIALSSTKQYTNARLRRASVYGVLGVTDVELKAAPACTRLLAANARGLSALHSLRSLDRAGGGIRVVTRAREAIELCSAEMKLDRLYTLAFEPALAGDFFIKMKPKIVMASDPAKNFQ